MKFTKKRQAEMPMNELVEVLAQKAANLYNKAPMGIQEYYDDQGTAICFEDWPVAYNRINNPTKEDLKLVDCKDDNELFDLLDDKFCDYLI